jgi:uncharacterized protein YhbP (UPF0306 family)
MFVLDLRGYGNNVETEALMTIERSKRPVASSRMAEAAERLLDASTLCAIATVAPNGGAYINTAYFARSTNLDLVWLSEPAANHSRNVRSEGTVAVAVYDSGQSWGKPDRGIQLFGSAWEAADAGAADAKTVYANRFPDYLREDVGAFRFYVFHPSRLKLFDERELGAGRFVIARVDDSGRLSWEGTEIYRSGRHS